MCKCVCVCVCAPAGYTCSFTRLRERESRRAAAAAGSSELFLRETENLESYTVDFCLRYFALAVFFVFSGGEVMVMR